MPERRAAPSPRRQPSQIANRCPDGDALDRIADALERGNEVAAAQAQALAEVTEQLARIAPLAEGVNDLNTRLTKLCVWIRNNRVKILAAIVTLASTPNFLAPEAASALKAVFAAIGAAQ